MADVARDSTRDEDGDDVEGEVAASSMTGRAVEGRGDLVSSMARRLGALATTTSWTAAAALGEGASRGAACSLVFCSLSWSCGGTNTKSSSGTTGASDGSASIETLSSLWPVVVEEEGALSGAGAGAGASGVPKM